MRKWCVRQNRVIVRFLGIALACLIVGTMLGTLLSTASAAKFNIGDIVRTTNELYVRQGAGTGYTTVKLMHANTAGAVLQGPQAADGYTWWKVRYDDDVEGWSSDHRLEKYARASPKFSVGHNVQTTGELHVRSKPGLDYSILKTQPAGVTGTILDFPVPRPRVVDGYNWWKVRYSDGTQGWSSDHRLQKYTTPPDLTVTSVSAPSSAKVEDTISVSFTVKNQGGSSSGSFSNRVSLATSAWGTTYSLGNFSMSSLGLGASSPKTVSVTIPSVSPGYYYVTVFTDGFQAIAESNENNNIGSTYPSRISITKPTPKYTLTTSVSPWGSGSVSPGSGSYDEGTRVALTASPASGYIFDHWGGGASGTSTTVTITMNSNKSITAYFVQDTGTINVTSNPSGAPFNLSGPASYSGTTPWSNTNAVVGTYTIIWDSLSGYSTPPSETKILERDGTIFFRGVYQPVTEIVSIPNTPSGPSSGTTGISYTYSTGEASSNLGHSLQYQLDWGDGTYSSWSSSISASHSWSTQGAYTIRAQARCATHTFVVSGWSSSKSVTINLPTPTPQIIGTDPIQPIAQPNRQRLGILGTGFVAQSEVILRIGTSEYPIPSERTQFVSAIRINVFVGLTDAGMWTAQVINSGNRRSNVFSFTVVPQISEVTAAIDNQLLDLIDEYASTYYNSAWNLNINQYKAWIATIAWAEGGKGGYVAHSQYGGGYNGDRFDHRVVGSNFRFSTGIGPFQLDRGGGTENWGLWPTIDKLDPEKAVKSVLKWHYSYSAFGSGADLEDFAQNSPWFAINPSQGGNPASHWNAVTGANWISHKNSKAELDWGNVKEQLAQNATDPSFSYQNNVSLKGTARWSIKENEGVKTDTGKAVIFDGDYQTWLITSRSWNGTELFKYYCTYDPDKGVEVWVWDNSQDPVNKFRYIFVREYSTGQFPENRQVTLAGETLTSPAIVEDTIPPVVNTFSVEPDSVTLGNAFTISYAISDTGGSGLNRVELWRKNETVDWKEIERTSLVGAGDGPYSSSFSNVPFSTGTYWYGIHVVDNAGNWNDERNSHTAGLPGIFGPIKIEVIPTPTVYAVEDILAVLDAYFQGEPSGLSGGKVPSVHDIFNLLDAYFSS